jgi:signal transduction histidine kinase
MWKKGLVSKIVATFTTLSALTIIIIATILSFWFQNYYFEQWKTRLGSQLKIISTRIEDYKETNKQEQLENIKEELQFVSAYTDADIVIVDTRGLWYAASSNVYNDDITKNLLDKSLEELRLGKYVEKKSVYSEFRKENVYMYAAPVMSKSGMFQGGIVTYSPIAKIKAPLNKVYGVIWSISAIAVLIFSYLINKVAKKMIISPLAEINYVARKIATGEVGRRVELDTNDEISELADSFNTMADSLEKVENVRREFISNVSHELRSPITSIKGFIGGVIDGVIPKDKENYYLSIAYEEIQRLARLVNDLLDLSAIEAGKFTMNISQIDINEIIRLSVIRLESKINMKKLKVDVLLQDEHLYVRGDRDRLTQVLTNLLDNAIKYVNDGGIIKLHTRSRGDKVLVSIYNDGPCISEEDMKHVWDRFYKADKARTNKISTGLGLPIVRNILTQLGEDIWIENKDKTGVTFCFTLKKA